MFITLAFLFIFQRAKSPFKGQYLLFDEWINSALANQSRRLPVSQQMNLWVKMTHQKLHGHVSHYRRR